jgi:glycosyltransferase involved in cell wall biosynthesis
MSTSPGGATGAVRNIALLGNHAPRQCGIATFTTDLGDAIAREVPDGEVFVAAMNDVGRTHVYPPRVRFEVPENELAAYTRAAGFLNLSAADVLCVQHEYGIFGGPAGSHLLSLLRDVRMPIVTTLHTILSEPDDAQRQVMNEILRLSERLVVMSDYGAALLRDLYGVPDRRIDRIPHGIASLPLLPRGKRLLGVDGKSVILTFGLLSRDKGIEYVIDALPRILERNPDTVYMVVGATHPHVKEREGETYRMMLESRARRLRVRGAVIFHDRFVSRAELADFLSAADIYITPYLKPEQIASGTLAYAVGSGRAVISTPYRYAQELLADGRGILVPWRDPEAIAREVNGLLGDEPRRLAMRDRAAAHGVGMLWPAVGRRYLGSFERAHAEHADRVRTGRPSSVVMKRPLDLPEVDLQHLQRMTDDTGMLQHCEYNVPRYDDGYCLDDNARALLLMAMVEGARSAEPNAVRALATRYLAFVSHAYDASRGRFRNFMSYDRRFSEECGSEDSHGRALWALGAVVARSHDGGRRSVCTHLFRAALPAAATFTSPRAWASTLLGIEEYLRVFGDDRVAQSTRATLASGLMSLWERSRGMDWPWFEQYVTYGNARLPQALLVSGARTSNERMTAAGLRSLEWLCNLQRSEAGHFAPVGTDGFYKRGGTKALYDQQPLEACAMISACLEAGRFTHDPCWAERAGSAFWWFLGQNHLQKALYDATTGGCRDGLHESSVNENQGAESTLAFLLSLLEMRAAADRVDVAAAGRAAPVSAQAVLS